MDGWMHGFNEMGDTYIDRWMDGQDRILKIVAGGKQHRVLQ